MTRSIRTVASSFHREAVDKNHCYQNLLESILYQVGSIRLAMNCRTKMTICRNKIGLFITHPIRSHVTLRVDFTVSVCWTNMDYTIDQANSKGGYGPHAARMPSLGAPEECYLFAIFILQFFEYSIRSLRWNQSLCRHQVAHRCKYAARPRVLILKCDPN